jgi:hypothetical protein
VGSCPGLHVHELIMSTRKLVLMFVAWLFAAGAIAVTVAVVVTEMLAIAGVVDRSGASYGVSLNVITGVAFVALAIVPFVFRDRFGRADDDGIEAPKPSRDAK